MRGDVPLSEEEAFHSGRVRAVLAEAIAVNDGWINFEHYMEIALYAPGLGYYSAGASKLGRQGDFTTAPEISSLFGACVARQGEILSKTTIAELVSSRITESLECVEGALAAWRRGELDLLTAHAEVLRHSERASHLSAMIARAPVTLFAHCRKSPPASNVRIGKSG